VRAKFNLVQGPRRLLQTGFRVLCVRSNTGDGLRERKKRKRCETEQTDPDHLRLAEQFRKFALGRALSLAGAKRGLASSPMTLSHPPLLPLFPFPSLQSPATATAAAAAAAALSPSPPLSILTAPKGARTAAEKRFAGLLVSTLTSRGEEGPTTDRLSNQR